MQLSAMSLGCPLAIFQETFHHLKYLVLLARPKRFELLTPRLVIWALIGSSQGFVHLFEILCQHPSGSLVRRTISAPTGGSLSMASLPDLGYKAVQKAVYSVEMATGSPRCESETARRAPTNIGNSPRGEYFFLATPKIRPLLRFCFAKNLNTGFWVRSIPAVWPPGGA
jgi:hypothetical protein